MMNLCELQPGNLSLKKHEPTCHNGGLLNYVAQLGKCNSNPDVVTTFGAVRAHVQQVKTTLILSIFLNYNLTGNIEW